VPTGRRRGRSTFRRESISSRAVPCSSSSCISLEKIHKHHGLLVRILCLNVIVNLAKRWIVKFSICFGFLIYLPLLPHSLLFKRSQHHKSPYRVAALVLSILSFLFGVTYLVPIITGAVAVFILFLTLCVHLKQPVLYVAILGAVIASLGNFVSAARNDLVAIRAFAIIAGFLWLISAFLIYKIPVHAPSGNSDTTTSPQPEFDMSTTTNDDRNEPV
jgi:hypothetical protein